MSAKTATPPAPTSWNDRPDVRSICEQLHAIDDALVGVVPRRGIGGVLRPGQSVEDALTAAQAALVAKLRELVPPIPSREVVNR